ncbi:UNVERIFIED_CONTAM: hypothetical protein HDU68_000484 [Siphonaria sp. JEL0065]|nr:hypothetical protein HDU68_000484 [Siphonaria sp. JEL0065]
MTNASKADVSQLAARADFTNTVVSAHLTYFTGPVIANVKVIPIYYGAANYQTQLNAFYAGVTQSPWIDLLAQYGVGRGTFGTPVSVTASKTTLDDVLDIQPFLINLVKAGTIVPTANTYFPIHFAPNIYITMDGDGSCKVFCAYHGTIDISSLNKGVKYLYYGVMPDQGGGCNGGCGGNSQQVNNLFSVSSHELAEMLTDPAVGVATVYGYPLSWYDKVYGEVADICNAQQGTTKGGDGVTYVIQKNWSNADNACLANAITSSTTSTTTSTTTTTTTNKPTTTSTTTTILKPSTTSTTTTTTLKPTTSTTTTLSTASTTTTTTTSTLKPTTSTTTTLSTTSTTTTTTLKPTTSTTSTTTTKPATTSTTTTNSTKPSSTTINSSKSTATSTTTTKSTTTTTTTKSTTSSTPGPCAHDKCVAGVALKSGCSADACVTKIITGDAYCGSSQWDSVCVGEVKSICGIICPSSSKSTTTTTTTAKPATSTLASTCSHAVCVTGSLLKTGCSTCASAVIAKDAYCGGTAWDETCVAEVAKYCSPNPCV